MEVYAVRHGESEWNAAQRITGWSDIALSALGREQAARAGEFLRDVRFHNVWSSDLCRAADTARIALREPVLDRRLRELNFGEHDGQQWTALSEFARQDMKQFDRYRAPGGESFVELRERVISFLNELEPGVHAVFCHGGVVRAILHECGASAPIPNCAVAHFSWSTRVVFGVHTPAT